jgi:hypothetical protein
VPTKLNSDTGLFAYSKRRGSQLSVVSVQSTNIPPREMVTYAKQTQTVSSGHERDGEYEPALFCTEVPLVSFVRFFNGTGTI